MDLHDSKKKKKPADLEVLLWKRVWHWSYECKIWNQIVYVQMMAPSIAV